MSKVNSSFYNGCVLNLSNPYFKGIKPKKQLRRKHRIVKNKKSRYLMKGNNVSNKIPKNVQCDKEKYQPFAYGVHWPSIKKSMMLKRLRKPTLKNIANIDEKINFTPEKVVVLSTGKGEEIRKKSFDKELNKNVASNVSQGLPYSENIARKNVPYDIQIFHRIDFLLNDLENFQKTKENIGSKFNNEDFSLSISLEEYEFRNPNLPKLKTNKDITHDKIGKEKSADKIKEYRTESDKTIVPLIKSHSKDKKIMKKVYDFSLINSQNNYDSPSTSGNIRTFIGSQTTRQMKFAYEQEVKDFFKKQNLLNNLMKPIKSQTRSTEIEDLKSLVNDQLEKNDKLRCEFKELLKDIEKCKQKLKYLKLEISGNDVKSHKICIIK